MKEKRFDLGAKGVNVVASPLHLPDGSLTFAQNVAKDLSGEGGGIAKRPGHDSFVDLGANPILALFNVALRPARAQNPDTGIDYEPGDPMYAKVFKTASETTVTGVMETVTFDAEDFDVGNLHDLGANTERLTVPPGGDGIYLFVATCSWEGRNAAGGRTAVQVFKNGIATRVGIAEETPDAASGDGNLGTTYSAVGFINMVAGDYLVMRVQQNSGADLDLLGATADLTSFAMVRLFDTTP
ncbi:MAG TPA: hypothetical protein VGK73_32390 [Polyangiaceae bacterium]